MVKMMVDLNKSLHYFMHLLLVYEFLEFILFI